MKRYAILVLAILLVGLAAFLYQSQTPGHWYGSFRIGENSIISFIAVGNDVFHDSNSDGIPQGSELVGPNRDVNVTSDAGDDQFTLHDISVLLVPASVSSDLPQLLNVEFQSKQHASICQIGTVTMSLDRDNAETCQLMGPLSFLPFPTDFELNSGELNSIKILIGTAGVNGSPDTGALVRTSPKGDRTKYAFADSERPNLKIWFGEQTDNPQTLVVDEFC